MKPRTNKQRAVWEASQTLPPITEKQRDWAFAHCFPKKAFLCKKQAWCSECGKVFDASTISPLGATMVAWPVICPHCGKKLQAEVSRKQKYKERFYYTIVTTHKGYQVCRNFSVEKEIRKGGEPYFCIEEVVQNWIDTHGHEEIVARPIAPLMGYYDAWQYDKPMELRDGRRYDMYRPDKYRISGAWIYPHRTLLPIVKRNGYTARNKSGIPESEHIKMLLTDNDAEWLEKTGQYYLFALKYYRGSLDSKHAVKVANRAGYKVKDASLWNDYIRLLEHFGFDTHNAHYVCPKNLKSAHDRLAQRKQKEEARQRKEAKIIEAAKWEQEYSETKGRFFGICFGNEDIVITVIRSVADIAAEGEEMYHCVYQAEYFKRKDSLILSARDSEGSRLETIELSLTTFEVVQSRGKYNKFTERHDEIVNLVRQNIGLFREVA